MRFGYFCLSFLLFSSIALASDPAERQPLPATKVQGGVSFCPPSEATSWTTVVYRLTNATANDVAVKLNEELQKDLDAKPKHNGIVIESPIVVIPDTQTNCLIVSAKSRYAEKAAELIKRLDAPGRQVRILAKLTITEGGGKKNVISRPQIITLDGQPATIEIVDPSGKGFQLELTPEILSLVDKRAGEPAVAK